MSTESSGPPLGGPPRPPSFLEREFPTVMRYAGLLIAMYEGLVDRPPQGLVIVLAAVMMAGATALEKFVERRS
jgi:hypothetical protein